MKKVCVYAICKNEIDFVDKWLDSMSEADYIVVLDTGSTDGTYEKIKNDNRITRVEQKVFDPFRFDVARNYSLDMVPDDTDIFCCIDLDERFDPGWANQLRDNWTSETRRAIYPFVTDQSEDGEILGSYLACKIHSHDYYWKYPVHEILVRYDCDEVFGVYNREDKRYLFLDNLILRHYQDKSKPRSQYLDLIKLRIKEDFHDMFAYRYLAKEFCDAGLYDKELDAYQMVVDKYRRYNSYCGMSVVSAYMVGDVLRKLGRDKEAARYYAEAIVTDGNYLREPWLHMAELMNDLGHYGVAISLVEECLNTLTEDRYYWNRLDSSWREKPYDILGICYYNLHDYKTAEEMFRIAHELAPGDERIAFYYHKAREALNA